MDASHFLVGGLTAISVALLFWIEIHSRHDAVAQREQAPIPMPDPDAPPRQRNRSRGRR